MKTNIKMRVTPEQSVKVQEILNMNGESWLFNQVFLKNELIFINDNLITSTTDKLYFNNHKYEEIDTDMFIRTNGTCEEDNIYKIGEIAKRCAIEFDNFKNEAIDTLNKYVVESTILNLEQKLKKKNEILKKARIKRKNQREELHKLNLKLQKCISLEEHDLKMKTVLNEKHKLEVENIEMGKLVNLNKRALDLAVITKELAMNEIERKNKEIEKLKAIIEYLESKVK